jgi:hypothetical protein
MRRPQDPPYSSVEEAGASLSLLTPYRVRPFSLAAPTHHIASGAALACSRRVCEVYASGYEGGPTLGRVMRKKDIGRVYRIVARSELDDRYALAFEGMRMETEDGIGRMPIIRCI